MTPPRAIRGSTLFLRVFAGVMALCVALPLVTIAVSWFLPAGDVWAHLRDTVLNDLLVNSMGLLVGVGVGTLLLGVPLAWLVANFEFPGRRLFGWTLLGPLAIPAYVSGFVYVGLLESYGPLARFVQDSLGLAYTFEIRSFSGVTAVFTLALYPYVFFIAHHAFSTQGRKVLEVGRSLGKSPTQIFWTAALPLARPWIMGALALVAMETLADFGTVSVFVFDTFTTAIYKSWFGFFSPHAAAQLSSLLLVLVLAFLILEKRADRRKAFFTMGSPFAPEARLALNAGKKWAASAFCLVVILLGFIVPFGQLFTWTLSAWEADLSARTLGFAFNSLMIGAMVACSVVACVVLLVFALRFCRTPMVRLSNALAATGYALPGAVLAIGVFLPLARVDHAMADAVLHRFKWDPGLLLTGTAFVMVFGLTIRFLAVAHSVLSAALRRTPLRLDEASQSLGTGGFAMMRRIHIPLLRSGLLTALILVFVDTVKEMPLTLMTRPFGWDTLAVKIYEFTSEGEWRRAALPAILLCLVGLIPVGLLSRQLRRP